MTWPGLTSEEVRWGGEDVVFGSRNDAPKQVVTAYSFAWATQGSDVIMGRGSDIQVGEGPGTTGRASRSACRT